jgi:hypothetical protein
MKNEGIDAKEYSLKEIEVAEWLAMSVRTLQGWRVQGKGPAYRKQGRSVRYSSTTIQMWLCAQQRSSTSATAAAGPCNRHNCICDHQQSMGDQL